MMGRAARKREPWRRFAFKAALIAVLIVGSAEGFAARYQIAYDPQTIRCLPDYSVYLLDRWDRDLERGGLYAFAAHGLAPFFPDGTRMVKKLVALPGDTVAVNAAGMFVNGAHIASGLALAKTLEREADSFEVFGALAKGQYWFAGEHELSFDSRYWGSVAQDQIIGRAYPLF